ncbi:hypothetical protein RRG08_025066 [Elysia crispata]|uniref:Uncharacterized protein n=1 Tax=Elysia crispata TaxID=231223 RepID=A0AAE1AKB8_9GAST|nr:hypothetical protein RRG08_025066 [Elysia crispata]
MPQVRAAKRRVRDPQVLSLGGGSRSCLDIDPLRSACSTASIINITFPTVLTSASPISVNSTQGTINYEPLQHLKAII